MTGRRCSTFTASLLLTISVGLCIVGSAKSEDQLCGPTDGQPIYFSGAPSVQAIAQAWKTGYQRLCSATPDIVIEGDSSADGVARNCATRTGSQPVDIGGLSREIYTAEAKSENDWQYDCERSRRNLIKVDVAVEGISLFTKFGGAAHECIAKLGGLTRQHLRWIYSSYNETKLVEEGWDASSVPFSDGNPQTHFWSEIDPVCAQEEILIAGEVDGSLVRKYFIDNIFEGEDEEIDTNRPNPYFGRTNIPELVEFVEANEASITFFGLGYTLQNGVRERLGSLESVPIQNSHGEFTKPGFAAIEDSSYLLARRLYMSALDEEESLAKTRPFFEFGFSEEGSNLLKANGFWPIHDWEAIVMHTRLQTLSGRPLYERTKNFCGPPGGEISIAGSSTVFPVARIWAEVYTIGCDVDIAYEGGGSSVGAGRVCGNLERGTPVDIGDMSREWKDKEADPFNDFVYLCKKGDPDRSAIQIPVAVDGLTVVVKRGGVASKCIDLLGGLTLDQLRWVFSSYTEDELAATGWNPTSVPFSDGDSQTHLWSELHDGCDPVEILISGPDDLSGTYEYFKEEVLTDMDEGETFAENRPVGYYNSVLDELLIRYVEEQEQAITFFGYAYFAEYQDRLNAVAIQNGEGVLVSPTEETIRDGSYEPLSRSIYMNLLNDKSVLQDTRPFVQFGFASDDLVAVTGYLAFPDKNEVNSRLNNAPYDVDGEVSGLSTFALIAIIVGGVFVVAILAVWVWNKRGTKKY